MPITKEQAESARDHFHALVRVWRESGPLGVQLMAAAEDREHLELMLTLLVGREAERR